MDKATPVGTYSLEIEPFSYEIVGQTFNFNTFSFEIVGKSFEIGSFSFEIVGRYRYFEYFCFNVGYKSIEIVTLR